jgi:hypothetical protein
MNNEMVSHAFSHVDSILSAASDSLPGHPEGSRSRAADPASAFRNEGTHHAIGGMSGYHLCI